MNKVYSFIELLTAIKNGEIEENTKFVDEKENLYRYDNVSLLSEYGDEITDIFDLRYMLEMNFTLIEENTIDEIEELDITTILDSFVSIEHQIREIKAKTNELVQAVNKINKKLREEE